MTALALARLGYLGFDRRSGRGARRRVSLRPAARDGSWPLAESQALTDGSGELAPQERYSMIPLQTALPLRGLAACGYATDPRAERAYEWLLAQRLPDGAWPTGIAAAACTAMWPATGGWRTRAGAAARTPPAR